MAIGAGDQARAGTPAGLGDVRALLLDMDGTLVDSDAAELLRTLDDLGLPWAVVTSASRRLARAQLQAAGITPPLLVTLDDVARGKPDPEGFLIAAGRLGVDPRACLVVEDSAPGVEAGRRAGALVAALGGLPADLRVHDLTELAVLLRYRHTAPFWQDAVGYQVYLPSFQDGDGDGDGWGDLHLFRPEQPDLNWRHPAVADEVDAIIKHWLTRGLDGFRVDTAAYLVKHPDLPDNTPLPDGRLSPLGGATAAWRRQDHRYDLHQPDVHAVHARWRRIADRHGAFLVGEVYELDPTALAAFVTAERLHSSFWFGLVEAGWDPPRVRAMVRAATEGSPRLSWALGNHDRRRAASRYGGGRLGARRQLALHVLTAFLPGTMWLYQGEELALVDGAVPPEGVTVQANDPASPLCTMQRLLAVRRLLLAHPDRDTLAWATPDEGDVVVYRRGCVTVAVNLGDAPTAAPPLGGRVVLDTDDPVAGPEWPRPTPAQLRPQQAVVLATSTITRADETDPADGGTP